MRKKEDLIFPTIHGSALSDMAMNMQIRRSNSEAASRGEEVLRDDEQSKLVGKDVAITQHGTSRASFKTWTKSDENAKRFNADAVELCLASPLGSLMSTAVSALEFRRCRGAEPQGRRLGDVR